METNRQNSWKATYCFFYGDTVVGYDSNYFTDDDNEIKPGETIMEEMDCYEHYDSIKVYLTGRRSI